MMPTANPNVWPRSENRSPSANRPPLVARSAPVQGLLVAILVILADAVVLALSVPLSRQGAPTGARFGISMGFVFYPLLALAITGIVYFLGFPRAKSRGYLAAAALLGVGAFVLFSASSRLAFNLLGAVLRVKEAASFEAVLPTAALTVQLSGLVLAGAVLVRGQFHSAGWRAAFFLTSLLAFGVGVALGGAWTGWLAHSEAEVGQADSYRFGLAFAGLAMAIHAASWLRSRSRAGTV